MFLCLLLAPSPKFCCQPRSGRSTFFCLYAFKDILLGARVPSSPRYGELPSVFHLHFWAKSSPQCRICLIKSVTNAAAIIRTSRALAIFGPCQKSDINFRPTRGLSSHPFVFNVPSDCATHNISSFWALLSNSNARNQFPGFEAL
jgi:hypothetical protein